MRINQYIKPCTEKLRYRRQSQTNNWKSFLAGTAKHIKVKENLMNEIILVALVQGQSRKEAYERMVSNAIESKTL